ncbi:PKD domain-containing protein [Hymenobacter sp. BRD128]|uniref:PKD domain-containing protein n=1 Tax=Hymenobacter sp. BRD128 TaxID=2675878 RepID=UPI001564A058|nr:PKD domain-containing protein [Hymenobacter sp. BRD128]QKG57623.1 PKD domain-containing protein [Hymenobacter sp. BRD128]
MKLPLLTRLGRLAAVGLVATGLHPAAWAQAGGPPPPTARQLAGRPTAAMPPAVAAQPTDRHSRLGGDLQRLYRQQAGAASRTAADAHLALRASFPRLKFNTETSSVLVRITAQDVNALLPGLASRGFQVMAAYPDLHFVEGMLPLSQLAPGSPGIEGLVSRGLLGVLPMRKPQVRGGLVTSQADYALEAARARATRPGLLSGKGVRIGVMSDSFNSLDGAAADVASGDLPAGVQVLQDLNDEQGGTDEGRAMSQLIYDLAPGAGLAFSSVYLGEGNFAQQVLALADPAKGNCQILVDDIAYFGEPFYQDGVIAQAINQVVAQRNVTYFSAAGNEADQSYENNAPQFVQATIGTRVAARLNFDVSGATTDVTQRIVLANGKEFFPTLEWSDPYYTASGVKTDLDLYLIAVKNGVAADTVARSDDNNLANQTPLEILDYTNNTTTSGTTTFDFVVVRRANTANPARVKYVDNGSYGATEWKTSSPTIVGHAAAASAQAVAAVPYTNQRTAEYFTSKGGALPFLFSPTGTPLTAVEYRQKPDIASIDGDDTTFFGAENSGSDTDGNGYPNFYGTSAAAPQAAAVAALLRESAPSLTPAQVYSRLVGSARLIGASATDPYTGPGLLDAFTAIYGPVVAQAPPAVQDLETGALPTSWLVNSSGAGRVQVTTALGPASGRYHLELDAPYTGSAASVSLNEVTWNLTGTVGASLQLTFRERKLSGETDEAMPAQFTTRSNTDGVALSIDGGTTWYRLVDLTGTHATITYQTKSVNLSQFAATNGLALGNDVRLRFQQYSGSQLTSAAVASQRGRLFDDIAVTSTVAVPIPLYTAVPPVGCPGLTVAFSDTSALRPTAWSWTFPGGTPATSTLRNPTVVYNAPGHYGVTLSVRNANGTAARTDTGVVFIYGRAPVATPTASRASVCPGGVVAFSSTASYCPTSYAWSFPGGAPASATAASPGNVTYATAGTYSATLVVSNAYGSTTYSLPVEVTTGRTIPFAENFDASLALPAGWTLVNPDGKYAWAVRDTTINRQGVRSHVLRAPFAFDAHIGERDAVYTPALNLASTALPTLLFDVAYATFTDSSTGTMSADSLIVQVADACTGTVLGRPYAKGKATLPTAATRGYLFIPKSAADWRQERLDLSPYAGRSVVVRFVGYNNFGNALYIDNVQVGANLLALRAATTTVGLDAWPNPTPAGAGLHVQLPAFTGAVSLRLVDNLGRVVWQEQVQQAGISVGRTLQLGLAPGLYNLLYAPAGGTPAARRIVFE